MFTFILAVLGLAAGLGGLAAGGWALRNANRTKQDYKARKHRGLPEGGVDARAVRDVALVRYDALEEMSGSRSFSLALLNASGDGVVVTSINGRTESRTYAKPIEEGGSTDTLSPEEFRAVRSARMGIGCGDVRGLPVPASVPGTEPEGAPVRIFADGRDGERDGEASRRDRTESGKPRQGDGDADRRDRTGGDEQEEVVIPADSGSADATVPAQGRRRPDGAPSRAPEAPAAVDSG